MQVLSKSKAKAGSGIQQRGKAEAIEMASEQLRFAIECLTKDAEEWRDVFKRAIKTAEHYGERELADFYAAQVERFEKYIKVISE